MKKRIYELGSTLGGYLEGLARPIQRHLSHKFNLLLIFRVWECLRVHTFIITFIRLPFNINTYVYKDFIKKWAMWQQ